jgi:predicted DNA binding CopG/RHH family protein
MNKYNTKYIDNEEKELITSYEGIDLKKVVTPDRKRQNELKRAAKSYIMKETKMNIRIDAIELEKIKSKAKQEGLKYSTLVKSVLHKYVTGQLMEKRSPYNKRG